MAAHTAPRTARLSAPTTAAHQSMLGCQPAFSLDEHNARHFLLGAELLC